MKKNRIIYVFLPASLILLLTLALLVHNSESRPYARFWAHGTGEHGQIKFLVFSQNGETLLAGDWNKASLWSINPRKISRSFDGGAAVYCASGNLVAAIPNHGDVVTLWNAMTGETLAELQHPSDVSIWSMALSPKGDILAVATETRPNNPRIFPGPGTAYIWDTQKAKLKMTLTGQKGPFAVVRFSPDGKTLATGSYDKTVKLWNLKTGRLTNTLEAHEDKVLHLAFSPNGRVLASGSPGSVTLWDVEPGRELFTLDAHEPNQRDGCPVAFHPSGQLLATANLYESSINFWNVSTGEQSGQFSSSLLSVSSLAFSPDGSTLAVGGLGRVEMWSVEQLLGQKGK